MLIESLSQAHHGDVLRVAKALHGWFSPKGIEMISVDVNYHHGFVAKRDGAVVGFATHFTHEGVGQIGWLGVLREYHRQGIGAALVQAVVDDLARNGVSELKVETLSDSVEYEPYERTRKFYAAVGFVEAGRIPMPDNPDCPEKLVLSKRISQE